MKARKEGRKNENRDYESREKSVEEEKGRKDENRNLERGSKSRGRRKN